MGDGRLDQGAGVPPVFSDQAVEEDEAEPGVAAPEPLDGLDDQRDAFPPLGDAAIAENAEFARRPGRSLGRVEGMEDLGVDAARGAAADDTVPALDPAAEALGIPEKKKTPADDLALELVAFQDEIEVFPGRPEAVEPVQDGILAAEADVERQAGEGRKGQGSPPKRKPGGRFTGWGEQGKLMAAPDELVPDLDVAADPPEDLGMGKKRGDPEHAAHYFSKKSDNPG